jgi:flagellar assembly protein FliH
MTTEAALKPAPYMFDEVFSLDAGSARASAPVITPATFEAAVAAAREEGHAAGYAEGQRAADAAIAARIAKCLEKLTSGIAGLVARTLQDRADIEATAVRLATTAAARLAPALMAREPTAELGALLRACLEGIRDVPHIAIRVSEDLVEPMRTEFEKAAAEAGFAGRVVILGEPEIAIGDGRIEWADGGIVRDTDKTLQTIESLVGTYVRSTASPGLTAEDNGDE